MVQFELQLKEPPEKPRLVQVCPARLAPSHSSPEFITPLPQRGVTMPEISTVPCAAKTGCVMPAPKKFTKIKSKIRK